MAQTEDFLTNDTDDLGAGSGRSSRQIRSDIDRTRADLDETFAALDSKLTPTQIGLEVWNLFKGGSSAGMGKLWRVARQHPMPAAVIGLGLGWLLVESSKGDEAHTGYDGRYQKYRSDYRGGSGDYGYGRSSYGTADYEWESEQSSGRLSAAKDKARDLAGSAKDAVSGVGDHVGEAADWTKEHALDLGHRAKDQASALKGRAKYQARRAKTGFWQTLEESPLLVGAATLAVGVIAGLAIPSTEKEDELMGETRDHLFEEVREAGEQVLEKGKHVAEAVADKVKEEAKNQGLTPEGVVEKVRTVAKEATNVAKEEAKNLAPEALKNQGQQGGQQQPQQQGQQAQPTPGGSQSPANAEVREPELANRR
ncbi:MAG TPA: DUF3618 domain-containing protein [Thermoanaerobaculia bacterium]|nr:DUF3618 domain-containing protein [Thermoanaerobaculia bacterium]